MTQSDESIAKDRELAAALRRATADPPADMVARMQRVAAGDPQQPRMGRVWTVALVAASFMLVVGAGMLVVRSAGDNGPADLASLDGNYLPSVWPAPLVSAIVTQIVAEPPSGDSASWLLAYDGVATAQLTAYADEAASASSTDAVTGVGDTWTASVGSDSWTAVAVGPRENREAIEQLSEPIGSDGGFVGSGLTLHTDRLPARWHVIDDPTGVLHAAFTGLPGPGTVTALASRIGAVDASPQPHAIVMTIRTGDDIAADDVVDQVDAFAGPTAARPAPGAEPWGIVVDQLTSRGRSFVYSPEPGIVVVISGSDLGDEDLFDLARSSRPVDAATWDETVPPQFRELPDSVCAALQANPKGLGSVISRNGITQYGGEWALVLSADLFRLTTGDRERVADAVRNDEEGYEAFAAELNESERSAFDTMRMVAMEPALFDELIKDDEVVTAADRVRVIGRTGCGFG